MAFASDKLCLTRLPAPNTQKPVMPLPRLDGLEHGGREEAVPVDLVRVRVRGGVRVS